MFGDFDYSSERRGRGWSREAGKSNNAVAAEENGLMTVGPAARALKIETDILVRHLESCEWHHVGPYKAKMDYYDVSRFLVDPEPEDVALLAQMRDESKALRKEKRGKLVYNSVWPHAVLKWVEFSGPRKRPIPHPQSFEGPVVRKGSFLFVKLSSGRTIKKLASGNTIEIAGDAVERGAPEFEPALDAILSRWKAIDEAVEVRRAEAAVARAAANAVAAAAAVQSPQHVPVTVVFSDPAAEKAWIDEHVGEGRVAKMVAAVFFQFQIERGLTFMRFVDADRSNFDVTNRLAERVATVVVGENDHESALLGIADAAKAFGWGASTRKRLLKRIFEKNQWQPLNEFHVRNPGGVNGEGAPSASGS